MGSTAIREEADRGAMHAPTSPSTTTCGSARSGTGTRWMAVHCQVCGSARAEQVLVEAFECPTGRRSGAVRLCPECGFLFAEQRELPGGGPRRPSPAPPHEDFAAFVSDQLRADSRPIGRLVDARAFSGELLQCLRDVSKNRLGLEADVASTGGPRDLGELSPIPLEANRLVPESVEALTALGLFERSADVRATLQEIERLLVPGGALFACAPDALALADHPRRPLLYGDVGHFTEATLSRLLRDFGLRVETVQALDGGRLCLMARKESRTALWGLSVGDSRRALRQKLHDVRERREALRASALEVWQRETARDEGSAAAPHNLVLVGDPEAVRFALDTLPIRDRVRLCVTPHGAHVPFLDAATHAMETWQPAEGDLIVSASPCALASTPDELRVPGTRHIRLFPDRTAA